MRLSLEGGNILLATVMRRSVEEPRVHWLFHLNASVLNP